MIPLPLIEKGQAILAALEHQDVEGPIVEFVVEADAQRARFTWSGDGWLVELDG